MSTNPAPRSGWGLQRKAMAGGGVAILVLGIWLGTLLDGLGLGTGRSGDAEGDADTGGTPVSVATEDVSVDLGNPTLVPPAPLPSTTDRTPPDSVEPSEMIAVLVRGEGYGLLRNPPADTHTLSTPVSKHFQPSDLNEVVALAQAARGNASGVKVQIVKHKSSTVGSDSALRTALREAGISDESILIRANFED